MKISRDSWLGLAILSLLIVVMIAAVMQQNKSAANTPYLSTSSSPDGTLALKLWLKDLGYSTFDEQISTFALPADVKTVFIIQPVLEISDAEWLTLDKLVEDGGTLLLAGDNYAASLAMGHYKFSTIFLGAQIPEISLGAPLLRSPLLTSSIPIPTDMVLITERNDFVPVMLAGGEPVTVSFKQGKGKVILSASPILFANAALKKDPISTVTLNLIALTSGGAIWFDEWHHGIQAQSIVGPDQWLKRTPGGHALLFTVFVVFAGLLLQGRAFGRAVPMLHESKRRGPLEHVTAIANLKRKAGHRAEVLLQYHQRVKRQLGQRYRLDPSIPDAEYVNALAGLNSSIDKDELLILLKRLSRKNISEVELIKLASEAAKWMKD